MKEVDNMYVLICVYICMYVCMCRQKMMVPPSMPKRIVMVGNGTNPWIHCQVGIRVFAIYMYVPAYVCMYVYIWEIVCY